MNTNVKLLFGTAFFFAMILTSCNKDDELKTTSHDLNEAMTMLHQMTDEIATVPLVSNPGEDFARIMKVHHKWAMNLATLELSKGDDQTVNGIAQVMNSRNEVELIEFQDFLDGHTPTASEQGKTWDNDAKVSLETMHKNADKEILTGDTDHDYAIIIINHHQSAIDMAKSYLRFGSNVNLRSLADRIVLDQSQEIKDLQSWLLQNQNQ